MPENGVIYWGFVMRLEEDGVTTKTGLMDEAVLFDLPWHNFLIPALRLLKVRRGLLDPLFAFDARELLALVQRACLALGMHQMEVELYSFRHGGASFDALSKARALIEVKRRLKHVSDLSTRRYEKAGRVSLELQKMPSSIRAYGASMESLLASVFLRPVTCPQPPKIL